MGIYIQSQINTVYVGDIQESQLKRILSEDFGTSKKIVIVDEITQEKCWPYLMTSYDEFKDAELFVLPAGEENKNIDICVQTWGALTDYQIQRNDVIINLGGGVITDMGGFIASVYKRGMHFINIPTTLLAMVDASVGGKTGIDFAEFKNQLGVFSLPEITVCDPIFLTTLDERQLLSGRAEMLKHGLIASEDFFYQLVADKNKIPSAELIHRAIQIKTDIVDRDFKESGERKKLNFGHTIGHAIESHLLTMERGALHGECVAWGMLAEVYISHKIMGFNEDNRKEIEEVIRNQYNKLSIGKDDFSILLEIMKNDKKNQGKGVNFTLLSEIGEASINHIVDEAIILESLEAVFGG